MITLLRLFKYKAFALITLFLLLIIGWCRLDIDFRGCRRIKNGILLLYIHVQLQIVIVVITLLRNRSFFLRIFTLCEVVTFLIWEVALIFKFTSILIPLNFAWSVWPAQLILFVLLDIVLHQLFGLNFLSFAEITFDLRVGTFNFLIFCCLAWFKVFWLLLYFILNRVWIRLMKLFNFLFQIQKLFLVSYQLWVFLLFLIVFALQINKFVFSSAVIKLLLFHLLI